MIFAALNSDKTIVQDEKGQPANAGGKVEIWLWDADSLWTSCVQALYGLPLMLMLSARQTAQLYLEMPWPICAGSGEGPADVSHEQNG